MTFPTVTVKEKTKRISLLNVFSGDSEDSAFRGEFCGNFDLGDCGIKRLKRLKIHAIGSGKVRVSGNGKEKVFSLAEGCNDFRLSLRANSFRVECFEVSNSFTLQRLEFTYS